MLRNIPDKILNLQDALLFVHKTRAQFKLYKMSDDAAIKYYSLDDHNCQSELVDFIGEDELQQSEHERELNEYMRETGF